MVDINERPPFDDAVAIAAIGILVDAGRVADASRVLTRYHEWTTSLPDESTAKLRDIKEKLEALRKIEKAHGVGAAFNLEHPAMVRELNRHARKPFLDEEHLRNAESYRQLGAAAEGTTSAAKSSSVS